VALDKKKYIYIYIYIYRVAKTVEALSYSRNFSSSIPHRINTFFLICEANARVKLAKTGHGPHSSTLVVICIVRLLFVLFYVLFVCKCVLPPGENPIAVNKYHTHPHIYIQGVPGGMCQTSGECSLC
jgi:hypothetical protein